MFHLKNKKDVKRVEAHTDLRKKFFKSENEKKESKNSEENAAPTLSNENNQMTIVTQSEVTTKTQNEVTLEKEKHKHKRHRKNNELKITSAQVKHYLGHKKYDLDKKIQIKPNISPTNINNNNANNISNEKIDDELIKQFY